MVKGKCYTFQGGNFVNRVSCFCLPHDKGPIRKGKNLLPRVANYFRLVDLISDGIGVQDSKQVVHKSCLPSQIWREIYQVYSYTSLGKHAYLNM